MPGLVISQITQEINPCAASVGSVRTKRPESLQPARDWTRFSDRDDQMVRLDAACKNPCEIEPAFARKA